MRVQKKLGIKGYHLTDTFIYKYYNSYHVHEEFPFIGRLNEIIHRLQSAGLYDEWKRRDDRLSDKKFIEKKLEAFKNQKQINEAYEIEYFPIPKFLLYGWTASIILLFTEITWKIWKDFTKA